MFAEGPLKEDGFFSFADLQSGSQKKTKLKFWVKILKKCILLAGISKV